MINIKEDENLSIINHSCAHLLAHSIKKIYPQALFWVGPVINDGFYYDIDLGDEVISEEDLPTIEKEMKKIAKDNKKFVRMEISKEEALDLFKDDKYKIDLINDMEDNLMTIYKQGEFIDLCRGPHLEFPKDIKYFKLLKVSGAYYKGDSNNKMLQRIYGICFESEEALNEHVYLLEEAKKRDHRKIGKELDLFFIHETAPGMPYWLPKGLTIFNALLDFWRVEHQKRGYQEFSGPQLNNSNLWKQSGHWEHYKEDMFVLEDIDGIEQALKPMNCPNAIIIYKSKLRSYRDLPLRFNDCDVLHRNEASGALHGLLRVKMFRQDDAHNFIRHDQIKEEINNILDIADLFYDIFNLKFVPTLSTRPQEFMGEINLWEAAEADLKEVLDRRYGFGNYNINEGDGAFYGPKIDIMMEDSLGRKWQMGTIQLDFQLPERFDLTYVDKDASKQRPAIIHRVIYGSIERFIGILIEHYAGAFPLWLSPVQINVIPVNNEYHLDYANEIKELLFNNDIRIELDDRDEKLSYKMRESQMQKIPYTVIIGDKEKDTKMVSYRKYGEEKTTMVLITEFIELLKEQISNKQ